MYTEEELITLIELFAHKLRNPAHSMGINLEVLRTRLQRISDPAAEQSVRHVQILSRELERLNLIVQRFTEYLAPTGFEKKKVRISQLFAFVHLNAEVQAKDNGVDLTFEPPEKEIEITINFNEMKNALEYIIQNSIDACGEDGKILVNVKFTDDTFYFRIQDNGHGIAEADAARISELYFTTKKGHVGMGLPLAIKYIEGNGGQLRLRSTENRGTIAHVLFKR